jgi:hypothetical protein
VFFINLPIAKLMHDAAMTYCKSVHNYLGTREGSVLNVHRPDSFGIVIELSSSGGRLLRRGRLIKKMLSNEELLVLLRQ